MPTPFPSRQPAPSNWPTGAKPKPTILKPNGPVWRKEWSVSMRTGWEARRQCSEQGGLTGIIHPKHAEYLPGLRPLGHVADAEQHALSGILFVEPLAAHPVERCLFRSFAPGDHKPHQDGRMSANRLWSGPAYPLIAAGGLSCDLGLRTGVAHPRLGMLGCTELMPACS